MSESRAHISIRVTTARKDRLEAYRIKHGKRSLNEAFSHLIDNAHMVPTDKQLMGAPYFNPNDGDKRYEKASSQYPEITKRLRDAENAQAGTPSRDFSPQPTKPGSRLKKGRK